MLLGEASPEFLLEVFIRKSNDQKAKSNNKTLQYYEVGSPAHNTEIIHNHQRILSISDLFKDSKYAIRIAGNSMAPSYPEGAIIGMREIEDKLIIPGNVYVIEKDDDLWITGLRF